MAELMFYLVVKATLQIRNRNMFTLENTKLTFITLHPVPHKENTRELAAGKMTHNVSRLQHFGIIFFFSRLNLVTFHQHMNYSYGAPGHPEL